MTNNKLLRTGVIRAGTVLALASLPGTALAHGSMEDPISRIYACYKENPENPSSPACIAAADYNRVALYDWMSVRIGDVAGDHQGRIPEGKLCSAGDATFGALDAPRDDWPATAVSPNAQGRITMRFHATAPHATEYIRIYATDDGYDPTQPLTWANLQATPFCELSAQQIRVEGNHYVLDCPFPQGLSGRELLYTIWQRSDSPEAFYACSDVLVDEDASDPDDPGTPPWYDIGLLTAETDLAPGSTLTFRLFNADGNDAETHDVVVNDGDELRDNWPLALAEQVNAASTLAAIGQLADGVVTPVAGATANRVYAVEDSGYSFVVDVTAPAPDPAPEPEDTWSADAVYLAGDRITYQSIEYEAKWWTAGDIPGASAVWKRITPSDGPITWNAGAVYIGGDQVIHEGTVYEARWWTQGDAPGTHEVWQPVL